MSPRARIALVVAAVAVLVIAFVAFSGSGGDDEASTTTVTQAATAPATTGAATAPAATTETATTRAEPAVPVVRVVGGKPQGGVQKLEFSKGDQVRFVVRSDVADEIHVHGYDVKQEVGAGGSAAFDFPAEIEGRFEVELENRGEQIASLEVNP